MGYKEVKNFPNVPLLLYGKAVIPDQIYPIRGQCLLQRKVQGDFLPVLFK